MVVTSEQALCRFLAHWSWLPHLVHPTRACALSVDWTAADRHDMMLALPSVLRCRELCAKLQLVAPCVLARASDSPVREVSGGSGCCLHDSPRAPPRAQILSKARDPTNSERCWIELVTAWKIVFVFDVVVELFWMP